MFFLPAFYMIFLTMYFGRFSLFFLCFVHISTFFPSYVYASGHI
jgi:hypothetical protein